MPFITSIVINLEVYYGCAMPYVSILKPALSLDSSVKLRLMLLPIRANIMHILIFRYAFKATSQL